MKKTKKKKQTLIEIKAKASELQKQAEQIEKECAQTIGLKFLNFLGNNMRDFNLDNFVSECKDLIGIKGAYDTSIPQFKTNN